jgi:hypothetical protein
MHSNGNIVFYNIPNIGFLFSDINALNDISNKYWYAIYVWICTRICRHIDRVLLQEFDLLSNNTQWYISENVILVKDWCEIFKS